MKSSTSVLAMILLGSLVSGLIAAGLVLWATVQFNLGTQADNTKTYIANAQKTIANFRCPYSDTRHVIMHGKPDAFNEDVHEKPLGLREKLKKYPGLVTNLYGERDFDDLSQDKSLWDYFILPQNITQAMIVIGVDTKHFDYNDIVKIGNFEPRTDSLLNKFEALYANKIKSQGWQVTENLLIGNFAKLTQDDISLLDYLNTSEDDSVLDVFIGDDIAVDFAAVIACTRNTQPKGMSFTDVRPVQEIPQNIIVLSCQMDITKEKCNPYRGDTVCATELPVACIKDSDIQGPPADLTSGIHKYWSQADIALSPPIAGDKFITVDDVHSWCQSNFGSDWRVASYHDGGGDTIAGWRYKPRDKKSDKRIWINIQDQNNANCWSNTYGDSDNNSQKTTSAIENIKND